MLTDRARRRVSPLPHTRTHGVSWGGHCAPQRPASRVASHRGAVAVVLALATLAPVLRGAVSVNAGWAHVAAGITAVVCHAFWVYDGAVAETDRTPALAFGAAG